MDRAYTVEEIDRMRAAVEHKWLFGIRSSEMPEGGMMSRVTNAKEQTECVEGLLRTYMIAGIAPEDLE